MVFWTNRKKEVEGGGQEGKGVFLRGQSKGFVWGGPKSGAEVI